MDQVGLGLLSTWRMVREEEKATIHKEFMYYMFSEILKTLEYDLQ